MLSKRPRAIHFVGIGGIGMSGIAELLVNLGYQVSGSDLRSSAVTRRLAEMGAVVVVGHSPENVPASVDVVVTSSAVSGENPEVQEARRRGTPVIPRAEMLAELMRLREGIAIAGSHGKTTTTSMLATLLSHAGLDPTVVVGGKLNALGSNAWLGKGDLIVVEADESDGSFLRLSPTISVITNIDPEHLDHYGSFEALSDSFTAFANKVPFYGLAVLCVDHPSVQALLPRLDKRHVTYGFSPQAEFRASDVRPDGLFTRFVAHRKDQVLGEIRLAMVGGHNVQNALAAIAVGHEYGIDFERMREALESFGGVQRRFTVRGEEQGVLVVDDYGHHPAEIRATLKGARSAFTRRIVVAFQPHRYTRTRDLMDEFATSFNDADCLVLTDVFAAGEAPIEGACAKAMLKAVRACGHRRVEYAPRADLARHLAQMASSNDLVLTFGAGDITRVGEELLGQLRGGVRVEKESTG